MMTRPAAILVSIAMLLLTAGSIAASPIQQQNLAAQNQECVFFETTGQNVCGPFLDFWQEHGGLAVFGYPLTGELTENGLTVQYFERQRFEFHPENSPE